VGDFNEWDHNKNPMEFYKNGVWVAFAEGLSDGDNYKYYIHGYDGSRVMKADPFAFHSETRPGNASKVWDISGYEWHDADFIKKRMYTNPLKSPVSIYEVHLGSWRTKEGYYFPSYRELADELSGYVSDMGYTHIELLPVSEYPYDGSWGYQVPGFYSITSRYGTPQDSCIFIDKMHTGHNGDIMTGAGYFPGTSTGLPLRRKHGCTSTIGYTAGGTRSGDPKFSTTAGRRCRASLSPTRYSLWINTI
jgi:1,4-alpha-glucan branching enzyme